MTNTTGPDPRQLIAQLLIVAPQISTADIARATGVSESTIGQWRAALAVREPAPHATAVTDPTVRGPQGPLTATIVPTADATGVLCRLRGDPLVRRSGVGRYLLRWFELPQFDLAGWLRIGQALPPHYREPLTTLARDRAETWTVIAELLEQHGDHAERPSIPGQAIEGLRRPRRSSRSAVRRTERKPR